jgi:HAE1 family hydrophobic/amphiphilic exporter-1
VFNAVSTAIRGKTAWSIKWISNDHDVKIYFDSFLNEVSPSDIENINIYVWGKTIKAWSVINYNIVSSAQKIEREKWYIQIWVNAWVVYSSDTSEVQNNLIEYANNYAFPKWVSYRAWWENEENSELINSVISGVFIAFFLIFTVLVYQFNSYWHPALILYSVFMSLTWVIFWLYLTWNPISMPVAIWFISLMWIVVNDDIVMVDKVNINVKRKMWLKLSIIEWAVSRLNPILVTTFTTVAWILPIALQDPFWAGLWFTVAYWLWFGSLMTLIVWPALYYTLDAKACRDNL